MLDSAGFYRHLMRQLVLKSMRRGESLSPVIGWHHVDLWHILRIGMPDLRLIDTVQGRLESFRRHGFIIQSLSALLEKVRIAYFSSYGVKSMAHHIISYHMGNIKSVNSAVLIHPIVSCRKRATRSRLKSGY